MCLMSFRYNKLVQLNMELDLNMKADLKLMIPGPTPVPEEILEVLARPPIGHRSPEFKEVLKDVYSNLQWAFQTQRPVYLYTASGTGAMEAALVNVLNPGDEVLVLSCGVFSQRWAEIAKELGLQVHLQEAPAGQPHDVGKLETLLKSEQGKTIKAVCMIHNETSTGVINPVEELAKVIRENSDALVIVDTVTSLGATHFKMDEWGVDIAVSGSQKGFMLPPGLSFLAVSERALQAHQQCSNPGYYFNFTKYEKGIAGATTPYTPAVSLIRGLQKALEMMKAEGIDGTTQRHLRNRDMVRAAARAMALPLFVEAEAYASPSVTSIVPPEGLSVDAIRAGIKEQFNITIANGQKDLTGKIFRIGHLGAIFPRDILMTIASLEVVCHQLGYSKAPLGAGIAAAQEVMIRHA